MKYLKRIKIDSHELIVVGLILFAFLLRLGLISQGWPPTNSDEGTIGLMGLHIAFKGEHPTFYYGQYYMGPHQAVVAAFFFRLFGPSLFLLRLGLLCIFTLFLISTYALTRILYSKGWALVSLFMLSVGSIYMLERELTAIGGYTETLLFGSLLMLLASWLVVSYRPYRLFHERRWRIAIYLLWGIIAGTAIWDDLLIAPFALMAGLVLVIFCWREMLQLVTPIATLIGLLIGVFPLLYYNLHAERGKDSLTTLLKLSGSSHLSTGEKIAGIIRSIGMSVPMMTGEPFCQANELHFLGPLTSYDPGCMLIRRLWGYGYMLLFVVAVLLALWGLWLAIRARWSKRHVELTQAEQETQRWLRRQGIHLALLISGILTFYIYAVSKAPLDWPAIHARYLIGLLIVMPAIFWPLWQGLTLVRSSVGKVAQLRRIVCGSLLALVSILLVVGSITAYADVPEVRARNEHDQALISTLVEHNALHIYSEYWTCNKLIFLSNERIICAVLSPKLRDTHNRYHSYYDIVKADPQAVYAFPIDSEYVARTSDGKGYRVPAVDALAHDKHLTFQILYAAGYVLYLPG
ncbi:hypothetical protein [Ktedonospora formicarum]|uniref:Glycosyltransferase RgtA/B/C/D-like domain-containing protein n=1 Tax=Ktedonospora formicarum TaxID=2778364 RepID=A0A8J3I130_9CHLR|nr:hypothetical protein [Ktedonospora formicarum]GHO44118.1 hypothetical protein KSX_22810 [Ktedonospora formicarum]